MTATIPTNTIFSVQVTQLLKNYGYHTPELNLPESEWNGIDITFLKDNVLIINGRTSAGSLTIRLVGEESTVTKPHALLAPLLELFGVPDVVLDPSRDVVFQAGRGMPAIYYKTGLFKDYIAEPFRGLVLESSKPDLKDEEVVLVQSFENDQDTLTPTPGALVVDYAEPYFVDGVATTHVVSVTRSPVLRDDEPHVHLS